VEAEGPAFDERDAEPESSETAEPVEEVSEEDAVLAEWMANAKDGGYMIVEVAEGETYGYGDDGFSIMFTGIDESVIDDYRVIGIREVTLTDEQREALGALSDTAYDVISPMENGDFEYELTLPTPEDVDEESVEVVYARNEDDLTDPEKVKTVDAEDVDVDAGKKETKVKDLDHFTIFFVIETYGDPSCVVQESEYMPLETVYAKGGRNSIFSFQYKIQIKDPNGTVVAEKNAKTEMIDMSYTLPENAPLGEWEAELYQYSCFLCGGYKLKKQTTFTVVGIPTLTLTKNVVDEYGGDALISDFTLKADDMEFTSGIARDVSAGTYTLSESGPSGYAAGSWSCDGGTLVGSDLTIGTGETVSCEITNTARPAELRACKFGDLDGDGVKDAGEAMIPGWTMTLSDEDGATVAEGPTGADGCIAWEGLSAGDYAVTETNQEGWTPINPITQPVSLSLGDAQSVYFGNRPLGRIVVSKETLPKGSPETFAFSAGWSDADFFLSDGQTHDSGYIVPGTYSLAEIPKEGWEQSGATCSDGSDPSSILLDPGETVTCSFVNAELPTLRLDKTVVNDHGGSATVADFEPRINGQSTVWGTDTVLAPGSYRAGERILRGGDGYAASVWGGDCSGGGFVTLRYGDHKTCSIVNDDIGSSVTLRKVVRGGAADEDDFGLTVGGTAVDSGETVTVASDTPIVLDEEGLPGYSFVAFRGDEACPDEPGEAVTLGLGEDLDCTIVNERDRGSLRVNKVIDADGDLDTTDDQETAGGWTFELHGTGYDTNDPHPRTTDREGMLVFDDLKTGRYSVVERTRPGYEFIDADCGDRNGWSHEDGVYGVRVSDDEETVCTFYNAPDGMIRGSKWHDEDMDGERDEEEDQLAGWTMFLDENGNGTLDPEEESTETSSHPHHFGRYRFSRLFPGTYSVCEVAQDGWNQTYPGTVSEPACHTVTVPERHSCGGCGDDGDERYDFGNVELGSIRGRKFIDRNGDGIRQAGERFEKNWTVGLYADDGDRWFDPATDTLVRTSVTGDCDGDRYCFDGVVPGRYYLAENLWDGYVQSRPLLARGRDFYRVRIEGGETKYYRFGNYAEGSISGMKWEDTDEDGTRDDDENGIAGWNIGLCRYEDRSEPAAVASSSDDPGEEDGVEPEGDNGEVSEEDGCVPVASAVTDEEGAYSFGRLGPGRYRVTEETREGWEASTGTTAEVTVSGDPNDEENVVSGIDFGNYRLGVLSIGKVNDADDEKLAGERVRYTLTVTASEGRVKGVKVADLPPEVTTYTPGSWSASSSLGGAHIGNLKLDHVYASPGIWDLGDLQEGETITLAYDVTVNDDVDPGDYPDLAFARGLGRGGMILAEAGTDGNVGDDNYVGTAIIVKDDSEPETVEVEVDAEEEEEEVESEVLGESTELPATGMSTFWITLSAILIGLGALLLVGGSVAGTGKLPNLKAMTKRFFSLVFAVALGAGLLVFAAPAARAETDPRELFVRMEEPKADWGEESFILDYVVLDTVVEEEIDVECQVSTDGVSFTTFETDTVAIGGDSGQCAVDSSELSQDDVYTFRVKASTGTDDATSTAYDVAYDTTRPGQPEYIGKDREGDCRNKVELKTADDGQTESIEIYRDDSTTFDADADHLIKTVSIGPDEQYDFIDHLPNTYCGETVYYAVRAFDDAGNGSEVRAEDAVETVRVTTGGGSSAATTETVTLIPGEEEEGAAEATGEGAEAVEAGEGAEAEIAGEEISPEGEVEGVSTTAERYGWIFWVLVAVAAGYAAYWRFVVRKNGAQA